MIPLTRRQALAGAATTALLTATESFAMKPKDLIIINAKVTTLDRVNPVAQAVAIRGGRFLTVGSEAGRAMRNAGSAISTASSSLQFSRWAPAGMSTSSSNNSGRSDLRLLWSRRGGVWS